jgi:hypothetical protein
MSTRNLAKTDNYKPTIDQIARAKQAFFDLNGCYPHPAQLRMTAEVIAHWDDLNARLAEQQANTRHKN